MSEDQVVQLLTQIRDKLNSNDANTFPQQPLSILGGDLWGALPYLDGWNYDVKTLPGPLALPKGQKKQPFPDIVNQEGWFVGVLVGFSDPDCHVTGSFDNLQIQDISPRLFIELHNPAFGAQQFKCNCYDPSINLYGLDMSVNILAPYNKRTSFSVYLGPESRNTIAYLKYITLTNIAITDRRAFFISLRKFAYQESVGRREVKLQT